MKFLRSLLVVLAIGAVTLSTANARDSFSVGINIGGYGNDYHEPVRYYSAPHVVYEPTAYHYEPARSYYHAPVVSYRYYGGGHYSGGHHGYEHKAGHGWGNGHRGQNDSYQGGHDSGSRRGHHDDDD